MKALIVGTAACVWNDLEAAGPADVVYVLNRMGFDYPDDPDFWVITGKPREAELLAELRMIWRRTEISVPTLCGWQNWEGGALFATMHAFGFGADKVLLAGTPLVPEMGHYYRPGPAARFMHHRDAWLTWKEHHPEKAAKVRSLSGWTAQQLGLPDAGWFRA